MTTEKVFNIIENSDLFKINGPDIDILGALQELCNCIQAEEEIDGNMGEFGEFTLDGLIVGAYWALTHCHGGQSSESYSVLCSLGSIYSPGTESGPEEGTSEFYVYETISERLMK